MSGNTISRQARGIASQLSYVLPISQHREDSSPNDTDGGEADSIEEIDVSLDDVHEILSEEFGDDLWGVTEALLSAHATLLIGEVKNCIGVIVVGESGAGKTTAIRFFEGLAEQTYRSDDATPASFVSHDASRTDDELSQIDLLPRVSQRTLTSRDMATWFAGPEESIRQKMALMAHLMDGDGYTRDSGSHGRRGYRGDYRFTFIGATTPLEPRAWKVMGHTGYRFVFYALTGNDINREELEAELFGETRYPDRVRKCRETVHDFLAKLWHDCDGYRGVKDPFETVDQAKEAIAYLGQLVRYSRATLEKGDTPRRENPKRVGAVLRDIAKGRALLDGRTTVDIGDVQVSARIALSTMPRKRRPLIQSLINPSSGGKVSASQAEEILGVSRPTALNRMSEIAELGLAELGKVDDDGRNPKFLRLNHEFEWLDNLEFPEFGGR